jgi:hypothetical protein
MFPKVIKNAKLIERLSGLVKRGGGAQELKVSVAKFA